MQSQSAKRLKKKKNTALRPYSYYLGTRYE